MVSKSQIKLITSLQQKKYRRQHGLFIAEGKKVIQELLHARFRPEFLFETEPVFKPGTAISISDSDLKKISALSVPNNCLAVFRVPDPEQIQENGLIVVLDEVRDPGNLGSIVRLCDWFGVLQLVCSENSADVYNPKTVQASMGSLARVNVHYQDLRGFIKKTRLPVIGTFMEGENVYKTALPAAAILILGNEANGISPEVESLCTRRLSIPRFGALQQTESLNVATAAAILLSEFRRSL